METFEWLIVLMIAAAGLSELARRTGSPYPTLLALGGVGLAFLPNAPRWTLDPQLALALFVAPVLLDAAYDTSLRDLRAIWRPVAGLVVAAVGTTVLGVAAACHWLVPDMSWPVAIVLGAVVAPPDAAAATAVMRQVGLPHRVLSILEGESLFNDASALFIYRLALMVVVAGPLGVDDYLPMFFLTVFGSIAVGMVLAIILRPVLGIPKHAPTSLILQFSVTFAIWIFAEHAGLSGILTIVAFAMMMARGGGPNIPATMRVPILAVWETVVFVLNAFAFILIGMQLRPIWERLGSGAARIDALVVATVVLAVTVGARFIWVLGYSAFVLRAQRKKNRPKHGHQSWSGGLVVSWAGMRGIVTLAAAFAIPETLSDGSPFPHRDLVLLCAFSVVFGTLVVQGGTMKTVIRRLGLSNDGALAVEVRAGRREMYQALIQSIATDESLHAKLLKKEYQAVIDLNAIPDVDVPLSEVPCGHLRRLAINTARKKALELRNQDVIGDHAYRILVQELDWAELSAGGNGAPN